MGVSEKPGTLLGGPLKGILFYLGEKRGTPYFRKPPIALTKAGKAETPSH